MKVVCLDTNVVMWAYVKRSSVSQNVMIDRAKNLIVKLKKDNAHLILPAIVYAELLSDIPSGRQAEYAARFEEDFRIIPFDQLAAWEFSRIIKQYLGTGRSKGRQALKADAMILATALAGKATRLYTHDQELIKKGSSFLDVQDIPAFPDAKPDQFSLIS